MENGHNKKLGKHREFQHFAGKTQGILHGKVVNFLVLNIKDIVVFVMKFPFFLGN